MNKILFEQLEPRVMLSAAQDTGGMEDYLSSVSVVESVSPTITFPDANLEEAIREELGTPEEPYEGDLTTEKLAELTELDASNRTITDLTGLEYCVNLTSLDLSDNLMLSDISQLASLTNLTELNLSGDNISDITALASLTDMEVLNLSDNANLSDITSLGSMTQMLSLNLKNCDVTIITSLASMQQLQVLNLKSNSVSNISSLETLTNMKSLDLSYNRVSNVSYLSDMDQLESLLLPSNRISNISSLDGLDSITTLWLNDNSISNINALASLNTLTELNIRTNSITDISPLSGLTSLTYLSLAENSLSDISDLATLVNLTELHLQTNDIESVDALKNMTAMEKLYLSKNQISDIDALAGLVNLVELRLADNYLFNVNAVEGMTKLEMLDLRWNIISKIDPIINNAGIGAGDTVWLTYALNPTNVENEIDELEARGVEVIWQSYNSTVCSGVSYVFTDINGDTVTVKLTGDGKAYLTFSENPGENNQVSLADIEVVDSSSKTSITITVKKNKETGDGKTTLGGLTSAGLLKSITGKDVIFSGDLFIDEDETATADDSVSLYFDSIEDANIDTNTLGIKSLTLDSWTDTDPEANRDTIETPWLTTLKVKGGSDTDADFSADITLTGADAKGYAMKKFTAKGVVEMELVTEDETAILGTFTVGTWLTGGITSTYVKKITTKADRKREGVVDGDCFAAFELTGIEGKKGLESLGSLKVAGLLDGVLSATGAVGTVSAGQIENWAVIAADNIKSVTSKGDILGAVITTGTLGKITAKYDMAVMVFALLTDAKGYSVGTVKAGGEIGSSFELEGAMKSIKAGGGAIAIEAEYVDSITIKGGKNAAGETINGDLETEIILNGANSKAVALGKLSVKGVMTGDVIANEADVTNKDGQEVTLCGSIGSITVGQWTDGGLSAGIIKKLTTKADKKREGTVDGDLGIDIIADSTNHDAFGKVSYTLGTVNVAGDIVAPAEEEQATWTIEGLLKSITVKGSVTGLNATADNISKMTLGGIFDSVINVNETLGSFTVKGWKVPRSEQPPVFAENTNISAGQITKASIVNWDIENPLTFTLDSAADLLSLKYKDTRDATSQKWSWTPGDDWPTDAPTENEVIIIND